MSVHWYGKLRAPFSEDYTFFLSGDDGFRLYVGHVLKVDRWDACCDDMVFFLTMAEGVFYDLRIEYREL